MVRLSTLPFGNWITVNLCKFDAFVLTHGFAAALASVLISVGIVVQLWASIEELLDQGVRPSAHDVRCNEVSQALRYEDSVRNVVDSLFVQLSNSARSPPCLARAQEKAGRWEGAARNYPMS